MRSPKSRSRSKNNRNRSVGNIVNRVFDSSGPEGKVRGTPQQIIDKYNQLARDAQLGNDRVATENFQQHAEHYTRMLSDAQREADARREQHEQQNRDRQRDRGDGRSAGEDGTDQSSSDQQGGGASQSDMAPATAEPRPRDVPPPMRNEDPAAPVDTADQPASSGLVETPEDAETPKRPRRARKPKPRDDAASDTSAAGDAAAGGSGDGAKQAAE